MGCGKANGRTLAVLVVLAALTYLNALPGAFIWGDVTVIVQKADLVPSNIPAFFTGPILSYYRPLVFLSFALKKWISPSPFLFHLTNLLLHVLATCLVLELARRTLATRYGAEAPLFAALAFALLPAHTGTVTWIAGRADLLVTVGTLAGLLVYIGWREGVYGRLALALRRPARRLGIAIFFLAILRGNSV